MRDAARGRGCPGSLRSAPAGVARVVGRAEICGGRLYVRTFSIAPARRSGAPSAITLITLIKPDLNNPLRSPNHADEPNFALSHGRLQWTAIAIVPPGRSPTPRAFDPLPDTNSVTESSASGVSSSTSSDLKRLLMWEERSGNGISFPGKSNNPSAKPALERAKSFSSGALALLLKPELVCWTGGPRVKVNVSLRKTFYVFVSE